MLLFLAQMIWYLYGIDSQAAFQGNDAPKLVSAIVQVLGLKSRYIRMLHINDWDRFLSSDPQGILINPFNSSKTEELIDDIDNAGLEGLFMISTFSTADLGDLDGVLRLLPEDGPNVLAMAKIVAGTSCRRQLIVYDSQDIWSMGMTRLLVPALRNVGKTNHVLYDIRDPIPVPGDIPTCVIALVPDAIDTLRPILRSKQQIVGTILGDMSIALIPRTQEELDLLNSWNAWVLAPGIVMNGIIMNSQDTIDSIYSISGLSNITIILTIVMIAIQIAYYLLLVVDKDEWDDQSFFMGSYVDGYTQVEFTQVGIPATKRVVEYFIRREGDIRPNSVDPGNLPTIAGISKGNRLSLFRSQ